MLTCCCAMAGTQACYRCPEYQRAFGAVQHTHDWKPCEYCGGKGHVVTRDDHGQTYEQLCPRCMGARGFGSFTYTWKTTVDF